MIHRQGDLHDPEAECGAMGRSLIEKIYGLVS